MKNKNFNDYFTIEKINKIPNNPYQSDFKSNDIKILNTILKDIENIFSSDIHSCNYEMANERTYLKLSFEKDIRKANVVSFRNYLKDKPLLLIEKEKELEVHIKNI